MAINDVLPLKATRRDAIANFTCFWTPGHQQPNIDLFIYISYAAPLYSACISAVYIWYAIVGLGEVRLVQRLAMKQNAEFMVFE